MVEPYPLISFRRTLKTTMTMINEELVIKVIMEHKLSVGFSEVLEPKME